MFLVIHETINPDARPWGLQMKFIDNGIDLHKFQYDFHNESKHLEEEDQPRIWIFDLRSLPQVTDIDCVVSIKTEVSDE